MYVYTANGDYIPSQFDEITDEPQPNWMKWCHVITVFLKPLSACHLLAFGIATVDNFSQFSHLQCYK